MQKKLFTKKSLKNITQSASLFQSTRIEIINQSGDVGGLKKDFNLID